MSSNSANSISVDDTMKEKLRQFDVALTQIESKVAPFLKKPVKSMVPRLTPTENAKLNMAYSYTLNALYYMLLKTQGVSPEGHPVKKDLERVKRYMVKTQEAEKHKQAANSNRIKEDNTENTERNKDLTNANIGPAVQKDSPSLEKLAKDSSKKRTHTKSKAKRKGNKKKRRKN